MPVHVGLEDPVKMDSLDNLEDLEFDKVMQQPLIIEGVEGELINNNNICYFNSILQVLIHSPEFYYEFIECPSKAPLLITTMKKLAARIGIPLDC